ncbi:uncharacterized protein VTP21DRAFT_10710 [Calcarisporiella thermophila]|uniref:uncharacterized protein n=1 Tax=Calcarisporiella thermophila TaxID=911321 RepID=UPI0037431C80
MEDEQQHIKEIPVMIYDSSNDERRNFESAFTRTDASEIMTNEASTRLQDCNSPRLPKNSFPHPAFPHKDSSHPKLWSFSLSNNSPQNSSCNTLNLSPSPQTCQAQLYSPIVQPPICSIHQCPPVLHKTAGPNATSCPIGCPIRFKSELLADCWSVWKEMPPPDILDGLAKVANISIEEAKAFFEEQQSSQKSVKLQSEQIMELSSVNPEQLPPIPDFHSSRGVRRRGRLRRTSGRLDAKDTKHSNPSIVLTSKSSRGRGGRTSRESVETRRTSSNGQDFMNSENTNGVGPRKRRRGRRSNSLSERSDKEEKKTQKCNAEHIVKVKTIPFEADLVKRVIVQPSTCLSKVFKQFESCRACISNDGDLCRFVDFRVFKLNKQRTLSPDNLIYLPSFCNNEEPEDPAPIPSCVEHSDNGAAERYILDSMNDTFKLIMLREEEHMAQNHTIRKKQLSNTRQLCDYCMTVIFGGYWMCCVCGAESCFDCYESLQTSNPDSLPLASFCSRNRYHGPEQMVAVTRWFGHELREVIDRIGHQQNISAGLQVGIDEPYNAMVKDTRIQGDSKSAKERATVVMQAESSQIMEESNARINTNISPKHINLITPSGEIISSYQEPDLFGYTEDTPPWASKGYLSNTYENISSDLFRNYWRRGICVVVNNLQIQSELWTPSYFVRQCGREKIDLIDCRNQNVVKGTIEEFFQGFEHTTEASYSKEKSKILKLKDWPTSENFRERFPRHFDEFMSIIPFPEYTNWNGIYNLACRLPSRFVPPDLGPKLYIAYGSDDGDGGSGTTNLHCDMADAVNLMVYSADNEPTAPAAAVWDIYSQSDLPKLRAFLNKIAAEESYDIPGDPVHSQVFYLDVKLRQRLFDEYGVRSWRIEQRPGDAVFIPAGCAHQVCNYTSAIKIAMDFVSPENVSRCLELTQEFRKLSENHGKKEDVLQLKNILFYTWLDCDTHLRKLNGEVVKVKRKRGRPKVTN